MEVSIGDLMDSGDLHLQTGPFGTQLPASCYVEEGTPVINVRNIGYAKLVDEKLEYVPDEVVSSLSQHVIRANDIVFGRKGAVDRHLYVPQDADRWLQGGDCIRLRALTERVNMRFLSYSFLTEYHKKWMLIQGGNKATMSSLNHDVIRRIHVELPDRRAQDDIASVLSAYDDLIENNRKRIGLLERAARLIYKEWFVRLRFPGHEGVKVMDGVPEGWVKAALDTVAEVNQRSLSGKHSGAIQYVDIASVSTGSIDKTEEYEFEDAPGRARRQVADGDTIWSCVRPNRRSYAQVVEPPENMIVSTGFAVITPKTIGANYLYHAVTNEDFVGYLTSNAQGAAYPAVKPRDFDAAMILKPSVKVLKEFEATVGPMTKLRSVLNTETDALTRARDLLLPRLMSGKVKV